MSISAQEWQERLDKAIKAKVISARDSYMLTTKFKGGNLKLTPKQEEIYAKLMGSDYSAAKPSASPSAKGIDIVKWNKRIEEAFKAGKLSREGRFELGKKLRGEKNTLTEAEAEEIFKKMTERKAASAPGKPPRESNAWKEEIRKRFSAANGLMCEELLNKVNSGEIQSKEQFDRLMEDAEKRQRMNRNKIELLKNILKSKIKDAIWSVDRKCKYIVADTFFEEIEKGVDEFALYKKRTGISDVFNQGKDLDKVIDDIKDTYDKAIKEASDLALKEEEASAVLYEIIENLKKVGTDESNNLVTRLERVLNEQGPVAAAALASEGVKACQTALDRDRRRLVSDLLRAQKAADNDKESIALSFNGYKKINEMFGGSTYPLFKKWLSRERKEIYKVTIDEFIKNAPGKESVIRKKCNDAAMVIFADKKEFEDYCKAPMRKVFYMAKDLFKVSEDSHPNSLVSDSEAQSKLLDEITRVQLKQIERMKLPRRNFAAPSA